MTGSYSEGEDEEVGEPAGAVDFDDDFEVPFNPHLNLKDFDTLILDLERELSKQINVPLSRVGRDPGHEGLGSRLLRPSPGDGGDQSGPERSPRPPSRLLESCLVTRQPIAENHSSFPVLSGGALAAKARDWGLLGPAVGAIFSEYQGLLPMQLKGTSPACWAGLSCPLLLGQGKTSYCEHHPGMVRHRPPSCPLPCPRQSSCCCQPNQY